MQLKDIGSPDTLFVDDTVSLPLRWRAKGFKKGTVEITLTLGGKQVEKKTINLQTGEDLRELFNFVVPKDPEKRETQDLVATIEYREGTEVFKDTLTRTVRVADSKIRVLYIEHCRAGSSSSCNRAVRSPHRGRFHPGQRRSGGRKGASHICQNSRDARGRSSRAST